MAFTGKGLFDAIQRARDNVTTDSLGGVNAEQAFTNQAVLEYVKSRIARQQMDKVDYERLAPFRRDVASISVTAGTILYATLSYQEREFLSLLSLSVNTSKGLRLASVLLDEQNGSNFTKPTPYYPKYKIGTEGIAVFTGEAAPTTASISYVPTPPLVDITNDTIVLPWNDAVSYGIVDEGKRLAQLRFLQYNAENQTIAEFPKYV